MHIQAPSSDGHDLKLRGYRFARPGGGLRTRAVATLPQLVPSASLKVANGCSSATALAGMRHMPVLAVRGGLGKRAADA
jgi:hypothetical protein